MRFFGWTLLAACLANTAWAVEVDGLPGPKCYRKVKIEAVYQNSKRLVRKARLVHEEGADGQIVMKHFPAIYIEEKALVSPAYVLLQQVQCTRRILKSADRLPPAECVQTRGCTEMDPPKGR